MTVESIMANEKRVASIGDCETDARGGIHHLYCDHLSGRCFVSLAQQEEVHFWQTIVHYPGGMTSCH